MTRARAARAEWNPNARRMTSFNSKIRLINHRGYGRHTPAPLTAMIYLCCGGITAELPTGT